jgi:hypothetical protein
LGGERSEAELGALHQAQQLTPLPTPGSGSVALLTATILKLPDDPEAVLQHRFLRSRVNASKINLMPVFYFI